MIAAASLLHELCCGAHRWGLTCYGVHAQPYGDPHAPFQRKCAFDVGDYVSISFPNHAFLAPLSQILSIVFLHLHIFFARLSCNSGMSLVDLLHALCRAWASAQTAWHWDATAWATSSTLMQSSTTARVRQYLGFPVVCMLTIVFISLRVMTPKGFNKEAALPTHGAAAVSK